MSQYILIIAWVGLMGFLGPFLRGYRTTYVNGRYEKRATWAYALLVFIPIILMAGLRGDVGDTGMYRMAFNDMPSTFDGFGEYIKKVKKDTGFSVLSVLIKILITTDSKVYFTILAAFQGLVLVKLYRKYSCKYVLSVFLFLASTDYISWMHNGLRQFMAVTIILYGTDYMLRKKWVPAILLILLASTMHQSALLMIPVMFIVQGRAWNRKSILFLAVTLLAVMYVDQFTDILDNAMQETQYSNMVSDWEEWEDDGTNVLRVLVYAIPTILSFVGLRYIREHGDEVINFCANMSIISTSIYILSMVTSGIFIGRLPIYMSLYNYILLPWQMEHMFKDKTNKYLVVGTIGAYLIYYYYQMHMAWGYF